MTQISRIQPGHINTLPTSDVGPYTADQWAEMFRVILSSDDHLTQGPFIGYAAELEPTEAPANQLNVNTGGATVNGHWFNNNATVAFTPAAPAGNPRIDVIVICENNTALPVTAGIATANNLIFPTLLADYNLTASIEPFTARLAILPGNEAAGPVTPTRDVDSATLFMIPIAQYDIAVGGAVTNLTDLREYARHSTFHPQLNDRQGGSATVWQTPGNTDYETRLTGQVLIQCGVESMSILNAQVSDLVTVTFPVAYATTPVVFLTITQLDLAELVTVQHEVLSALTLTTLEITALRAAGGAQHDFDVNWLAMGPQA